MFCFFYLQRKGVRNMSEILHRGKRIDNNEWEYGYYCCIEREGVKKHYIIPDYASNLYGFEIIPETVGIYTGKTDKNHTQIFTGDIFFVHGEYDNGLYDEDRSGYIYVDYDEDIAQFVMRNFKYEYIDTLVDYLDIEAKEKENQVISNIYDNPKLLKE